MNAKKNGQPNVEPAHTQSGVTSPNDSHWWWLAACVVGLAVFAAAAFLVYRRPTAHGWELAIFHAINNLPNSLRPLFIVATLAPNALLIGAVCVVATALLKLWQLTWQLAAAVLGAAATGFLAKHFINRPRPGGLDIGAHVRAHETDAAFPSGHALIITVVVLVLWPYLPRGWRWLVALIVPVVGIARLYLGVHLPLDIIGGVALGVAIVACMRMLPAKLRTLLRFD